MLTDDNEAIPATMERVEEVMFIILVMKPSYRTYITPQAIFIMILLMALKLID